MLLFVDIRRGGASSQTEIADEENSSENDPKSGESDKNVDNSGDLSTSDESSESGGSASEGGSEVKADTALDIGSVYTEDYWISDSSYMSESWSGSGTKSDPYLISSAGDLALLSYNVFTGSSTYSGSYFKQTADIDLSAHYWMPIGGHCSTGASTSYCFSGNYDGGGYTISGLTTYYDSTADDLTIYNYVGLFGFVRSSESCDCIIHDVNIEDSAIEGYDYVGGIVGVLYYYSTYSTSTLYNCSNSASVTGHYSSGTGGVVGYARGSATYYVSVYNSFNSGFVSGYSKVGGVVGNAYYAIVHDCYNFGDVQADGGANTGGIVGFATYTELYNFYNCGDVSGVNAVGGIVGGISRTGPTSNAINMGNVTSSSTTSGQYYLQVGAIVGSRTSNAVYPSFCYYGDCTITGKDTDGNDVTYQKGIGYDGSTSAEGVDEVGVVEYLSNISTFAKMKEWFTSASLWNSDYAWDFDSVWTINENYNNGYPILRSALLSFAEYDAEGDFWYLLDGYLPQSYSGTDAPDGVDTSATTDAYVVRISSTEFAQVEIYAGTDGDYALVTYNSASSSASAWFVCEPVVWVVGYGESLVRDVTVAVTAKVVTCGYVWAGSATLGWNWGTASVLGMSVESLEDSMGLTLASMGSFEYDSFASSLSQTVVEDSSTTLKSSVAVSSVAEIDALGGAYATQCTDFVAFLLSGGSSTSGYVVAYWTRDLACELTSDSTYGRAFSYDGTYNQGVYVTSDGVLSNATLKTSMGARLSVSL